MVVVLIGASQFRAFESYILEISGHLQPPPVTISKTVVKNPLELVRPQEVDADYFAITARKADPTFHCLQADATAPIVVPTGACVFWVVRITVTNGFANPISNVVVTDDFGAELAVKPLGGVPVHVDTITDGSAGQTHYHLLWCVTGSLNDVAVQCNKTGDTNDLLAPGAARSINVLVFTRLNPAGRQEYTSACPAAALCYELDSGATATWIDTKGGSQMSQTTEHIRVGAGAADPGKPTPTGTLTATPTSSACAPVLLDFATQQAGTRLADQFANDGIHISGTRAGRGDEVVVFDSAAPHTPYPSLQVGHGNLAILRDDSGTGGTQTYTFGQARSVRSFVFVGGGPNPIGFAKFFDARDLSLGRKDIPAADRSSVQTIKADIGGVRRLEIEYAVTGGVTDIDLGCSDKPAAATPQPTPTAEALNSGDDLQRFLGSQPPNVLLEGPASRRPTPTPTKTLTPTVTDTPSLTPTEPAGTPSP